MCSIPRRTARWNRARISSPSALDGECHAYQTKTGDIGLAEWRAIAGEIQELVELPVNYPGIDKAKLHKAYLVTDGSISDPVRIQINDRNEDNIRKDRRYARLEVIGRDSLLKFFVDAQGRFLPRELPDMRSFLELYLDDGRAMLPKDKMFAVLEGTSFGTAPARKSDAIDAITSSLIITSYLLNSFEVSANHYAMAEGWSVLAACIARYAMRHAVPASQWRGSLDLVTAERDAHLASLRKEAITRPDFLEGDIRADGGVMLGARTTMVLGALACHELLPAGNVKADRSPDDVPKLICTHVDRRCVGIRPFRTSFLSSNFLRPGVNGRGPSSCWKNCSPSSSRPTTTRGDRCSVSVFGRRGDPGGVNSRPAPGRQLRRLPRQFVHPQGPPRNAGSPRAPERGAPRAASTISLRKCRPVGRFGTPGTIRKPTPPSVSAIWPRSPRFCTVCISAMPFWKVCARPLRRCRRMAARA